MGVGGPAAPPSHPKFCSGSLQVSNFDWKNCWKPDAPALLKSLTVSPDPIAIPGELTAAASGSTSVELDAPLSVSSHRGNCPGLSVWSYGGPGGSNLGNLNCLVRFLSLSISSSNFAQVLIGFRTVNTSLVFRTREELSCRTGGSGFNPNLMTFGRLRTEQEPQSLTPPSRKMQHKEKIAFRKYFTPIDRGSHDFFSK